MWYAGTAGARRSYSEGRRATQRLDAIKILPITAHIVPPGTTRITLKVPRGRTERLACRALPTGRVTAGYAISQNAVSCQVPNDLEIGKRAGQTRKCTAECPERQ